MSVGSRVGRREWEGDVTQKEGICFAKKKRGFPLSRNGLPNFYNVIE